MGTAAQCMAAWYRRGALVGLLLDRGTDIQAKDSAVQTPLHMAASDGHEAAIGLLLDRGADTEAKDSAKRTPVRKRPSSCRATESRSSGHLPTSESKGTGSQTCGQRKRRRASSKR